MSHTFLVTCPGCRGRFNCDSSDVQRKKLKLRCPYCDLEFHHEESPHSDE